MCTFYIAKIPNLGQQLGQLINFHSWKKNEAQKYDKNMLSFLEIWAPVCL